MSSISIPTFGDLKRYGNEADAYARQFGLIGDRNGDADAFRHAYASAEMTRQYNEFFANAAGSSWENFDAFIESPHPFNVNDARSEISVQNIKLETTEKTNLEISYA